VEGAIIQKIMQSLGIESAESLGDTTLVEVVYDRNDPKMAEAIRTMRAANPNAKITVMVADASEEAVAQEALREISGIRIRINTDIGTLAIADAEPMGLEIVRGKRNKHVLQVGKVKDEQLNKFDMQAFALAVQMKGVVVILNSDQNVDFATPTDVAEVLRSEIRAAQAIAQSA